MEFEHIEYKGITFPARDCTFTYDGKSIRRLIGSEAMVDILFSDRGVYADEKAKSIDDKIAYYLPHDELMTLSDAQILEYIYNYLDEGILEDF
jgi:hypothetical protein